MRGKEKSLSLVMKISLFLKRRKAERQQFEYDKWKLLFSLRFRPRNWKGLVHHNGKIYQLTNETEKMLVWIANKEWGLHFSVEGRNHGEPINIWGRWVPWRREVLKHALRAVNSPWINRQEFPIL